MKLLRIANLALVLPLSEVSYCMLIVWLRIIMLNCRLCVKQRARGAREARGSVWVCVRKSDSELMLQWSSELYGVRDYLPR